MKNILKKKYDASEVYTIDEFIDEFDKGNISRYDGDGFFCKESERSNISVWNDSVDYTNYNYIIWFNR